MQVKMLTSMAGIGFVWNNGDVVEVSAAEAARFVAAGFAELVRAAPVEVAVPKRHGIERARK